MKSTKVSRWLSLVFLAGFLCLLVFPSLAKEVPVKLSAESLNYDEDTGMVVASGEVLVTMEGISLRADNLLLDTNADILTAEGNVAIHTDGYGANVSGLTYDVSTEVTYFNSFKSILVPNGINGKIIVTADKLKDTNEFLSGLDGSSTTCDYDHPHYLVKAKRFVMYPNDRMVSFSNTIYFNGVPVLWLPVLAYSLKRMERKMPTFGHNEVEGDFLKTAWDYSIDRDNYGLYYLDYMSKKGWGYGLDRKYRLNDTNTGTYYLYHVDERDTGISDWVTKIRHQIDFDKSTKLILGAQYAKMYMLPSGRKEQTLYDINYSKLGLVNYDMGLHASDDQLGKRNDYSFNWGATSGPFSTNYSTSYFRSKNSPYANSWNQSFTHSQPLYYPNLTMSTNWQYFRNMTNEALAGNEKLNPDLRIKYAGNGYSLSYYANKRFDLDQGAYNGDLKDEYMETQPEILLTVDPWVTPLVSLYPSYKYGWYHEAKYNPGTSSIRNFSASRQHYGLTGKKEIPLALGQRLNLEAGVNQYNYSTGDRRYQLTENFSINSQGYNFFTNTVSFKRGFVEGSTPFFFDNSGSVYSYLDEAMVWYWGSLINWRTTSGYNFMTNKYQDINTTLILRPYKEYYQTVRTGWSIENQKYLDLYTSFNYNPRQNLSVGGDLTYDMNYGLMKAASDRVAIEWGEDNWRNHWTVKVGHSYDFFTKEYKMRDLAIVKDLHCWEVTYQYSEMLKETTLTFTLKAFPDMPVGWTTGRGFYFDAFEKEKGEWQQQFNQPSTSRI